MLRWLWLVIVLTTTPAWTQDALPRHIEVVGSGEVQAVPDVIHLSIGVSDTDKDLSAAQNRVAQRSQVVIDLANEIGIAKQDIQATQLLINPEYNWQDQQREFLGYRVNQQITLSLRDTSRYGKLVDGLVAADITELGSASLAVSDQDAVAMEALDQALVDARRKAERIAGQLSLQIDGVHSVSELPQSSGGPFPEAKGMAMTMARDTAPVFEAGTISIRQTVRVVFRLAADNP